MIFINKNTLKSNIVNNYRNFDFFLLSDSSNTNLREKVIPSAYDYVCINRRSLGKQHKCQKVMQIEDTFQTKSISIRVNSPFIEHSFYRNIIFKKLYMHSLLRNNSCYDKTLLKQTSFSPASDIKAVSSICSFKNI